MHASAGATPRNTPGVATHKDGGQGQQQHHTRPWANTSAAKDEVVSMPQWLTPGAMNSRHHSWVVATLPLLIVAVTWL